MPASFDPAPTQIDTVIDPAWLSAMLSTRWPDAVVRNVTVVETIVTQATKIRLALDVKGGDPGMPRNICIKGILSKTEVPGSASVVETLYYKNLAQHLPVKVPKCIYAELNATGDNGVIVMEDVIHRGGTFLSALKAFTPDEVLESIDKIAQLHATTWQGSAHFDLPWIPRFLDRISEAPIMPVEMLQSMLDGSKGFPLPSSVKDAAQLQRALQALATQIRGRPNCVIHGDAHAGNIFVDESGFGLVDWQILQKGEWAQDVAYHIAAVLSPEDRRTHERALLDHYRERLKALGGPDMDADDSWTRYRAALVYGYYLWMITQKVEPAIALEFVRRLGLAVADLESFAVLGI